MTEVSEPSSSGEIARVVLLFFGTAGPQGSDGARAQRSPWRGGTTGRGAVSETESSTPLAVPRFERSLLLSNSAEHGEDWGHALCLVGRLTRQKLSHASRGLRPEGDGIARADGSGRRSARQRRERGASGQSNTKNNRSRGLVEWA